MKGHIVMYVILAAFGVAVLSRPAAASALMITGGSVGNSTLGVLSGQYAQKGGTTGTFNVSSPSGINSFNLT